MFVKPKTNIMCKTIIIAKLSLFLSKHLEMKYSFSIKPSSAIAIKKFINQKNSKMKKVLLNIAFFIYGSSMAQQLNISLQPTNVNCQGLKNGQVTANVTGGVPPYQYFWSNGEQTQSISNLNSGYYKVKIIDQNGIGGTAEITLTEPEELRLTQFDALVYPNGLNTSCYTCNDGAIAIGVAGGMPPYSYSWRDGSTASNRTNLAAKDYQLTITDAFGCQLRELNISIKSPERDDWQATGNVNNNQTNFFGTRMNSSFPDLVFKSADNEGFRIKPNADALFTGRIGLGTNQPTEKFEVFGGNAKFGSDVNINGKLSINNLQPIPFNNITGLVVRGANNVLGNLVIDSIINNIIHHMMPFHVYNPTNFCSSIPLDNEGFINETPVWKNYKKDPNSLSYHDLLHTCSNVFIGEQNVMPQDALAFNSYINDGTKLRVFGKAYIADALKLDGSVDATNYLVNGTPLQTTQWLNNANHIFYNQGNVGLGTHQPQFKLDIQNANNAQALRVKGDTHFANWNDENEYVKVSADGANGYIDFHGNATGGSLLINGNSGKAVKIGAGGLEVGGITRIYNTVHAKQVKVCTSGWCDYVFENDYQLRPLADVETYIKEYKHLPEVPSEKEVSNSEIDIFEMQKIQMKKIEELTLYLIQIQKENKELQAVLNKK
jgi:hypothetical protein